MTEGSSDEFHDEVRMENAVRTTSNDSSTTYDSILVGEGPQKRSMSTIDSSSNPTIDPSAERSISTLDLNPISTDELGIPIPLKLRPFIKRLEESENLTDVEIMNIVFIVRVADAMLQAGYATFLTRSFVEELRHKLGVPELDLEIEISATRWSYQQGAVMTHHQFSSCYDGYEMQVLSRVALGVIHGNLGVKEGLIEIDGCCEDRRGMWKWEHYYRDFPGRIFVMGLVSSTGSVVFFGGTWIDMVVCAITGCVAGMVQYLCSSFPQLAGVEETLAAVLASILASLSIFLFEGSVCFPAEVLGTLLSNLYGISFVLSLYEITQNLVMVGLARFCIATLKTFVLAFGVVLGVWISAWGGPDRLANSVAEDACEHLDFSVDPIWFNLFFPILSAGALMQLQVSPKHWPVCLVTQYVGVQMQYLLTTRYKQPMFVANFVPAYASALSAHFLLVVSHKLGLTQMTVDSTAFLTKNILPKKEIKERLAPKSQRHLMYAATRDLMRYVDNGWSAGGHDHDARHKGYRRNNRFHHQRGDLWFCLLPTVYMLVPGAMIWRLAFFSIVDSSAGSGDDNGDPTNMYNFQALASGILVVGIGLVVGFRFGFATLWAFTTVWNHYCHKERCEESRENVPEAALGRLDEDAEMANGRPDSKLRPSLIRPHLARGAP